jgi:flagellar basal body-associated protein FliL
MLALKPGALWACAACTGQSDSAMAKGMNWGIMSLLVVIAVVLGGVTSFFVFLAKKSATFSANSVAASAAGSSDRV